MIEKILSNKQRYNKSDASMPKFLPLNYESGDNGGGWFVARIFFLLSFSQSRYHSNAIAHSQCVGSPSLVQRVGLYSQCPSMLNPLQELVLHAGNAIQMVPFLEQREWYLICQPGHKLHVLASSRRKKLYRFSRDLLMITHSSPNLNTMSAGL